MTPTIYIPRRGSKIETAGKILAAGPLLGSQLACALGATKANLRSILSAAIDYGYIVRVKDRAGILHYALGDQALDKRFTVCDDEEIPSGSGRSRWTGEPMVRSVTTPSVVPSAEALAAANPFGRRTLPQAAPQAEAESRDQADLAPEVPGREPLVTGLFNNGELMISTGTQSIKLSPDHTRKLFDYLDKVTDRAVMLEEHAH